MSEILDMKMKLSCKWECKLKKKNQTTTTKKLVAVALLRGVF